MAGRAWHATTTVVGDDSRSTDANGLVRRIHHDVRATFRPAMQARRPRWADAETSSDDAARTNERQRHRRHRRNRRPRRRHSHPLPRPRLRLNAIVHRSHIASPRLWRNQSITSLARFPASRISLHSIAVPPHCRCTLQQHSLLSPPPRRILTLTPCSSRRGLAREDDMIFLRRCEGAVKWILREVRRDEETMMMS